jgi:hypothetical protein
MPYTPTHRLQHATRQRTRLTCTPRDHTALRSATCTVSSRCAHATATVHQACFQHKPITLHVSSDTVNFSHTRSHDHARPEIPSTTLGTSYFLTDPRLRARCNHMHVTLHVTHAPDMHSPCTRHALAMHPTCSDSYRRLVPLTTPSLTHDSAHAVIACTRHALHVTHTPDAHSPCTQHVATRTSDSCLLPHHHSVTTARTL